MCRAPFSIVFMAALLGTSFATPAHKLDVASMAPAAIASLNRPSSPGYLGTDNTSQSNAVLTPRQNPSSNQIIPSVYRDMDPIAPRPALNPITSQTTPSNSGWRYIVALLGTLAIIGTIAVKRRKPGKPWK